MLDQRRMHSSPAGQPKIVGQEARYQALWGRRHLSSSPQHVSTCTRHQEPLRSNVRCAVQAVRGAVLAGMRAVSAACLATLKCEDLGGSARGAAQQALNKRQ